MLTDLHDHNKLNRNRRSGTIDLIELIQLAECIKKLENWKKGCNCFSPHSKQGTYDVAPEKHP